MTPIPDWRAALRALKTRLIPEWKAAWRLWSVRLAAIGALLQAAALGSPDALLAAWNAMPDDIRAIVPVNVGSSLSLALFVASIVARVLKQRSVSDD